ncbi:DUF6318 family protein [Sinomonas gamaensis]|uniref:DUF6318 family protein n=1 Tax=Sinomonas gamaensis TaxID=2565624 RepID=UPI0014861A7B|nr:DUF6318 family protein [Sinomonas gamaensis]
MALRRCLRLFLTVLVLVLLLALNACAVESPASSAAPSATAAAPPTTDPRPTPASSKGPARNLPRPVLPESAKQNTKEGFEAFTQYWFDTIRYARETGDVTPLKEASQKSCKMCQFQIDKASQIHANGGWSVGPVRAVRDFQADMILDPNKNVIAYFVLEESGSINYSKDGSVLTRHAAGTAEGAQVVYAHFDGTKWTIAEAGRA